MANWTPHQRTWVMNQRDARLPWATITTAYNVVFRGVKRTEGGIRLEIHKISSSWYHSNGVLGEMRAWCVLHAKLDFSVFTTPAMVRGLPGVHRGTERQRRFWANVGRSVLGPAVVVGGGGAPVVGVAPVVGGAPVVQMPVAPPVALPVAPPVPRPSVPAASAGSMRDGSSESSRTLVGGDDGADEVMVDAQEQQSAHQTAERKDSRGCPPPVFDDATMDAAFALLGMSRGCMLEEGERKMLFRGLGVTRGVLGGLVEKAL